MLKGGPFEIGGSPRIVRVRFLLHVRLGDRQQSDCQNEGNNYEGVTSDRLVQEGPSFCVRCADPTGGADLRKWRGKRSTFVPFCNQKPSDCLSQTPLRRLPYGHMLDRWWRPPGARFIHQKPAAPDICHCSPHLSRSLLFPLSCLHSRRLPSRTCSSRACPSHLQRASRGRSSKLPTRPRTRATRRPGNPRPATTSRPTKPRAITTFVYWEPAAFRRLPPEPSQEGPRRWVSRCRLRSRPTLSSPVRTT